MKKCILILSGTLLAMGGSCATQTPSVADQHTKPTVISPSKETIEVPETEVPGLLFGTTKQKAFTLNATRIHIIDRCSKDPVRLCVRTFLVPDGSVEESVNTSSPVAPVTTREMTKEHIKRAVAHLIKTASTHIKTERLEANSPLPGVYTYIAANNEPAYFLLSKALDREVAGVEFSSRLQIAEHVLLLESLSILPGKHHDAIVSHEQYLQLSEWKKYFDKNGKAPELTILNTSHIARETLLKELQHLSAPTKQ